MKASDANDLGSRMGCFAQDEVGTMDILDRLGRDPDRVFQMDAIVAATLDGMGLADDSPQAQAIREGLGRERQNAFLSALEGIADFLQYFIPGWGEVKGIANFLEAVANTRRRRPRQPPPSGARTQVSSRSWSPASPPWLRLLPRPSSRRYWRPSPTGPARPARDRGSGRCGDQRCDPWGRRRRGACRAKTWG